MGDILKRLFQAAFPADPGSDAINSPDEVLRRAAPLLRPVTTAYRQRYAQHGAVPKGVYWSGPENVKQRFDILCRIFDPADIAAGESSINDLGCGYGALYDYLKGHPIMRGGRYHGYDITQSLLDACQIRIKDPRTQFYHSMRATERADYSIVSGTYNMNIQADEGQWLAYVFASLQDLWDNTGKALAFNMLDIADKVEPDGLYYADPLVFEGFCRTHLSNDVQVVTRYGLPDFTIFVRR